MINHSRFTQRWARLCAEQAALITRSNPIDPAWNNGVFEQYLYPVVTAAHVATSSVERLLDYVINTPEDGLRSAASVQQRLELIRRNRAFARI